MKRKSIIKALSSNMTRKAVAVQATAFIVAAICAVPAFADEATAALTNINNFIFSIIRLVGFGIMGWALYEFGISISNHDGSARWRAFGGLAGGLIIVFAKEILQLIGVSM